VTAGRYAAAVRLARAADVFRVLSSVGMATEEDAYAVHAAAAAWTGATPSRSRRYYGPRRPDVTESMQRFLSTGVLR
jgi:hypothetical protein